MQEYSSKLFADTRYFFMTMIVVGYFSGKWEIPLYIENYNNINTFLPIGDNIIKGGRVVLHMGGVCSF